MRRLAHSDLSPLFLATAAGVQRATKMLDRAPINNETSPYKPAEISTQPLGFDVHRSKEGAAARDAATAEAVEGSSGGIPSLAPPSGGAKDALADIRRWQQSRIQSKKAVDEAQHIVGFASRIRSGATFLSSGGGEGGGRGEETDTMRLERAAREVSAREADEEALRVLRRISAERDTIGGNTQMFMKRDVGNSLDDVINFPQRVLEAEEQAFEEERKREMALAFATPAARPRPNMATRSVGNLTVVSLREAEAGALPTQPRDYTPLHPTRLLVKQLVKNVPRSNPYDTSLEAPRSAEEGPAVASEVFYRGPTTGGAIINAPTPPSSHVLTQHKLSRGAELVARDPSAVGDEADTLRRIQETDDLLLASHRHYAAKAAAAESSAQQQQNTEGGVGEGIAFRHPLAVNLNRVGSSEEHEAAKEAPNPIKMAIEGAAEKEKGPAPRTAAGAAASASQGVSADGPSGAEAEGMTPLEYQRYMDVMETQRQADIADAFAKAKAFEADSRMKHKARQQAKSTGDNAALHNKFAYADDAALKAQHAYLEGLLQKDALAGNAATSNGVQWIGTTPAMMGSRFRSFIVRVLGSSLLMGAVLFMNPSLLEPPADNLYVDMVASARKSDNLLAPRY